MTRKFNKKPKRAPLYNMDKVEEPMKRSEVDRTRALIDFAESVKSDYPEVYEKWLREHTAGVRRNGSITFPRQGAYERNQHAEGLAQVRLKISQRMKIVQEALAAGKMDIEWGSVSDSMQASELKVFLSGDIFGQLVHAFIVIDQKTADALRRDT